MVQGVSSWALEAAHDWIRDYLCKPHESIGRTGAVCPFVEPSLRADCLVVEEWPVDEDAGLDEVVMLIRRMVDRFGEIEWASTNATLHALVVVLPDLAGERARLLDLAHGKLKPQLVRRGLMLGQFHPECDDPAARNPEFPVSKSPVPMLALRHIAFHDVLFLNSDPGWFSHYAGRYGKRYAKGVVREPLFVELFTRACARWGRA
jgi:uncharacterized protein DUF6875